MQTKKQSLIESVVNLFIGTIIAFIIQIYVYELFDIYVTMKQNIYITLIFLVSSLFRSYVLRRLFNFITIKRNQEKISE